MKISFSGKETHRGLPHNWHRKPDSTPQKEAPKTTGKEKVTIKVKPADLTVDLPIDIPDEKPTSKITVKVIESLPSKKTPPVDIKKVGRGLDHWLETFAKAKVPVKWMPVIVLASIYLGNNIGKFQVNAAGPELTQPKSNVITLVDTQPPAQAVPPTTENQVQVKTISPILNDDGTLDWRTAQVTEGIWTTVPVDPLDKHRPQRYLPIMAKLEDNFCMNSVKDRGVFDKTLALALRENHFWGIDQLRASQKGPAKFFLSKAVIDGLVGSTNDDCGKFPRRANKRN